MAISDLTQRIGALLEVLEAGSIAPEFDPLVQALRIALLAKTDWKGRDTTSEQRRAALDSLRVTYYLATLEIDS